MLKATILAVGLAMAFGASAFAQPTPQGAGNMESTQEDAAAFAKAGMPVRDSEGAAIGAVVTAGRSAATGEPVVVVNVDGRRLNLAASSLKPAGDGLVSTMTKAEILAAAKTQG